MICDFLQTFYYRSTKRSTSPSKISLNENNPAVPRDRKKKQEGIRESNAQAGVNTIYSEIPDSTCNHEVTITHEAKTDSRRVRDPAILDRVYINTTLDLPETDIHERPARPNNTNRQDKDYELPLKRDPIEPSVYTSIQNVHEDEGTNDVSQQDKDYELPFIPTPMKSSVYTSIKIARTDDEHDDETDIGVDQSNDYEPPVLPEQQSLYTTIQSN